MSPQPQLLQAPLPHRMAARSSIDCGLVLCTDPAEPGYHAGQASKPFATLTRKETWRLMPGEHQAGNTARAEIAGQCQIYASALAVPLSDRGHEQATKCWASSDGRGTKSMKYLLARYFLPGICLRAFPRNTLEPASDATVATNRTSAGFLLKTLRIRKPRDVEPLSAD